MRAGNLYVVGLCSALFSMSALFAAEVDKPFTAQAEFGYLSSNGNSDSQSVNGKLAGTYDQQFWRWQGAVMALSAATGDPATPSEDLVTSAERYGLDLQADRKLSDYNSLFVKANYDDDRFSGFAYQSGFAFGYGHQLIDNNRQKFRIEVGPGFRKVEFDDGITEEEALLSTAFLFSQKLGETSSFSQSLAIDAGDQRSISTSVTSLSAQIIGQLAMKFSLTIAHNSDPAIVEGLEKASVDKETSINLVYSF